MNTAPLPVHPLPMPALGATLPLPGQAVRVVLDGVDYRMDLVRGTALRAGTAAPVVGPAANRA